MEDAIFALIEDHPVAVIAGWYLFNLSTQALPKPVNGNQFYSFIYRLSHLIAGNAGLAFKRLQSKKEANG